MACVYIHIRLDTDNIFYIGIGDSSRPYQKHGRNNYWKNIINITEYEIKILSDNITWENAQEAEMELIKIYGRKDLNLGNLCNLTDGGEGIFGRVFTEETKKKISQGLKGNKNFLGKTHSEENRKKLSIFHSNKIMSEETKLKISLSKKGKSTRNKKVINVDTKEVFESAKILAKILNTSYHTFIKKLNGERKNNTNFKYLDND